MRLRLFENLNHSIVRNLCRGGGYGGALGIKMGPKTISERGHLQGGGVWGVNEEEIIEGRKYALGEGKKK